MRPRSHEQKFRLRQLVFFGCWRLAALVFAHDPYRAQKQIRNPYNRKNSPTTINPEIASVTMQNDRTIFSLIANANRSYVFTHVQLLRMFLFSIKQK